MLAIGQFVTPQNSAVMPSAAAKLGSSPIRGANVQPNVAPMKNVGTISPPLKPASSVSAVNRIFSRNANGLAVPSSTAILMIFMPAPL